MSNQSVTQYNPGLSTIATSIALREWRRTDVLGLQLPFLWRLPGLRCETHTAVSVLTPEGKRTVFFLRQLVMGPRGPKVAGISPFDRSSDESVSIALHKTLCVHGAACHLNVPLMLIAEKLPLHSRDQYETHELLGGPVAITMIRSTKIMLCDRS